MSWTTTKLITLFRDLTGRRSTGEISDADIVDKFNLYSRPIFSVESQANELKGWYTFDTVASTGSYDIDTEVLSVDIPVYCNDERANLWLDEDKFYQEYPLDYDTENVPTDILLFDRTLELRPIPDDVYEVRLRCQSLAGTIVDPYTFDDTIFNGLWLPMVGYGAAILYLSQKGEAEIANEHTHVYKFHKQKFDEYKIKQYPTGKRSKGSF